MQDQPARRLHLPLHQHLRLPRRPGRHQLASSWAAWSQISTPSKTWIARLPGKRRRGHGHVGVPIRGSLALVPCGCRPEIPLERRLAPGKAFQQDLLLVAIVGARDLWSCCRYDQPEDLRTERKARSQHNNRKDLERQRL